MKGLLAGSAILCASVFLFAAGAGAFDNAGCGAGECTKCHALGREEAGRILAGLVDNVLNVEPAPVKGLWVVDVVKSGKSIPVYIDYSKRFLIGGQIIRIGTREDVTDAHARKMSDIRAGNSDIPLEDAVLIGKPDAARKVVVFSDPDCRFCRNLHEEMKVVVQRDPDVAFQVKLFSLNNSPRAREKAAVVICSKSLDLLEDAYAGKTLPPPICNTDAPEATIRLAGRLGIDGTPSMVLPDGRIIVGYRTAEEILSLLKQ